jgi:acetolactate synthase small subunit
MYIELINRMSSNDRIEMAARGVPSARISEWKNKGFLPTRAQALALAEVMGVNPVELETELVAIEASREAQKKPAMQRMLERMGIAACTA